MEDRQRLSLGGWLAAKLTALAVAWARYALVAPDDEIDS